ncbi:hypothetical protein SEA_SCOOBYDOOBYDOO_57 [Mycobacterium phage ScoobyDoobyDoo]|nr:hypothetical protein SEA_SCOOBYDOOBYDOO_57 [Mycobacterium phage ScoobyDoobyDoo]
MSFDREAWVAVWGSNTPMIVGGINDEFPGLPRTPQGWIWLVTRSLTAGHPTYRVALIHRVGEEFTILARGRIDKEFYGERGVIELARHMSQREDIQRAWRSEPPEAWRSPADQRRRRPAPARARREPEGPA